jgi:hypothetical protein
MSQLRKQLQSLKDEYKGTKYPGDLAYELLTPQRPIFKIVGLSAIACVIAASIVLVLLYSPALNQTQKSTSIDVAVNVTTGSLPHATTLASTTQPEDTSIVPVTNLASAPEFPSDSPVVPSGESIVPAATSMDFGSMPSFPSMPSWNENEDQTQTSKTSKESA